MTLPPFATPLPIDAALPALRAALGARNAAVLEAPPGAGKTTRVPLALLDAPWLDGRKIVMLEPRRLATRAAAARMASTLGERPGDTVGHRMRLDTRVSRRTRIEVVTEGVLSRMLNDDPALDDYGLVIFDEFHERSLDADLGLALTIETQRVLRPELRILVMSATLDGTAVAALLGDPPVIASEGRLFPVATRWASEFGLWRDQRRLEGEIARTVREASARDEGDVLVFLPGAAEIARVASRVRDLALGAEVDVAPLFGNLGADEQDRAIRPSAPGRRKIVLATSIAETSLTIEGVRVVIDGGLARLPRFSPRTGMTRLDTVRVSRAAADQRRGRAGRVAPGVCYRMWHEAEERELVAYAPPEITDADLAPLALELARAGVADAGALAWLDPPPAAGLAQARELLVALEAVDPATLRATAHGRTLASLGVHPRLAHMLVRAADPPARAAACALAALLEERDVLRGDGPRGTADVDVRHRLDLLRESAGTLPGEMVDRETLRRVRTEAGRLARMLGAGSAEADRDAAGALLALAYPDRVARRRGEARGRFLLRNGRGAALDPSQPLAGSEWLAIAAVDDRLPEGRVFLAAPLSAAEVEAEFADQIVEDDRVEYDRDAQAVVARRVRSLGAIVLADAPLRGADPALVARALARGLAAEGVAALPWSDGARRLRERLAFLHHVDAAWPDMSDATLAAAMEEWLAPRIVGMRKRADVAKLDLAAALLDRLTWPQRAALDGLAPTHYDAPSGSRLPIDYGDPSSPTLAVRLQEMFGLAETPRIAEGRVPLTLQLLSPAHRPVQVTRDLAGFWRSSYFDVKKDLRGRYPKHHWPDDPLAAAATKRAKPRK